MKRNRAYCQETIVPPFHLFEYQGRVFVYHQAIDEFICVSQEAKLALQKIGPNRAAIDTIQDVKLKEEIKRLDGLGFFQPSPRIVPDVAAIEKLLTKRYSTPWTKLELALSEVCNLACRYCYCGTCRDKVENQGMMSEDVARQSINWLFAMSGQSKDISITFFGGEPLMNKRVFKFAVSYSQRLAKLHGKKIFYSMTTNGTLLDDDVITIIKRYNFGLMVSLDGPQPLHDRQCPTRNGEGSHDSAVRGINKLMARRRRVTVRCTMAHPIPDMMNLIRYFENFGFSRIVLGRVSNPVYKSPCDFTKKDFCSQEKQMTEKVIPWILNELKEGRTPKYHPYAGLLEQHNKKNSVSPQPISPFKCGACRGTTTVGADGKLYPCHRFVGMSKWGIGTISNGPDYEKCKQFWRNYCKCVNKTCNSCWAYPICKGPCPWEIAKADGSFRINVQMCNEIKNWIQQSAYFEALYTETLINPQTPQDEV